MKMVKVNRKSLKEWDYPRFLVRNEEARPMHNVRGYKDLKDGKFVTFCGLKVSKTKFVEKKYIFPSRSLVMYLRVCKNCKRVNVE